VIAASVMPHARALDIAQTRAVGAVSGSGKVPSLPPRSFEAGSAPLRTTTLGLRERRAGS
jgi:hypothetical protein